MRLGDIIAQQGLTIRGKRTQVSASEARAILRAKCHRSDNISRPQKSKLNKELGDDSTQRRKEPTTMAEYMERYPGVHKLGIRGNFDSITTKEGI